MGQEADLEVARRQDVGAGCYHDCELSTSGRGQVESRERLVPHPPARCSERLDRRRGAQVEGRGQAVIGLCVLQLRRLSWPPAKGSVTSFSIMCRYVLIGTISGSAMSCCDLCDATSFRGL